MWGGSSAQAATKPQKVYLDQMAGSSLRAESDFRAFQGSFAPLRFAWDTQSGSQGTVYIWAATSDRMMGQQLAELREQNGPTFSLQVP